MDILTEFKSKLKEFKNSKWEEVLTILDELEDMYCNANTSVRLSMRTIKDDLLLRTTDVSVTN